MSDVFSVYEMLWRRAQREGAHVRYDTRAPNGEAGWFRHEPFSKPTIAVIRCYYKEPATEPSRVSTAPPHLPQPDIGEELITLGHEYGHFKSSDGCTERAEYALYVAIAKRRDAITAEERVRMPKGLTKVQQNDRLRAALYAALDDDARARIIREESLAWEIGHQALAELKLDDFIRYDERTKKGLHNHRYRLSMEDAWPSDL